jgi:hypothetical protein
MKNYPTKIGKLVDEKEGYAPNNKLPTMAGSVREKSFVHLIIFVRADSDEHQIHHLRQAPIHYAQC